MTDLEFKLAEYIAELKGYQNQLEEKKRRNPWMKDSIMLVLDRVDLETSYLND